MATFKPHYSLCPLLGADNLVSLNCDREQGAVVITLGANIVTKHKLSDQKPLKSWSTRQSNRLTCPCVYDSASEKYVGVLNQKHLCMWGEDDSNIEEIKKNMFTTNIYAVHTLKGSSSVVVYVNGYVETLESAILSRKEDKLGLLLAEETLVASHLEKVADETIVVLFTKSNKVYYVRLNDGKPEGNLSFTLVGKTDAKLLGKTVVNDNQNIYVLALWSDGELIQFSEQGAVKSYSISGMSVSSAAALVMLDATHIAIYGADSSDEGALLLLFDLKFGMNVATRRLKFFCDPPFLYRSANDNCLLLCVAQTLVVVPYILQPSLIWNLLDKKSTPAECTTQPEIVGWDAKMDVKEAPKNPLKFAKNDINTLAGNLWSSNLPHSRLYDELLPALKQDNDMKGICHLVSKVKDVPERWQADILNFFLTHFGDKKIGVAESKMLQTLLRIPYSVVSLLHEIRRKLTTKSTILLLSYLHKVLDECPLEVSKDNPVKITAIQVVDWISLLLDAHHHELLIASSDDNVRQLIEDLSKLVINKDSFLSSLENCDPWVNLLKQKKIPMKKRRNDWYSIQVVQLL